MITPKLCCPYCHQFESHVVNVRQRSSSFSGGYLWRRRQCVHCGRRFTTHGLEAHEPNRYTISEHIVGKYASSTTHRKN